MHSQVVAGVTTVNNLPVYFLANNLDDIMSDGDKKKKKNWIVQTANCEQSSFFS